MTTGSNAFANTPARPRLAILVNVVAPYRVPVYSALAGTFETFIFTSGRESNRSSWNGTEETLREAGIRVEETTGLSVPYRRRGKSWYDERVFHLPIGHFKDLFRTRPDAVITVEMGARTMVALAYGAVTRTPVWIWWGGTSHTESSIGPARKAIRSVLSRWACRWISYGSTSTEYLLSLGVERRRILQVQNCVDERLFQGVSVREKRDRSHRKLLFVGRMVPAKGVEELLLAASELRARGHEFELDLVGGGPELARYAAMADSLRLTNVLFRGEVTPEQMPTIYSSADCLVFPTLDDVWGLVVNEAMWSGVPVIASVYAGCARELVPPDQQFDPLDHEAMVGLLERIVINGLPPPDTDKLLSCTRVAELIGDDIARHLRNASRRAS